MTTCRISWWWCSWTAASNGTQVRHKRISWQLRCTQKEWCWWQRPQRSLTAPLKPVQWQPGSTWTKPTRPRLVWTKRNTCSFSCLRMYRSMGSDGQISKHNSCSRSSGKFEEGGRCSSCCRILGAGCGFCWGWRRFCGCLALCPFGILGPKGSRRTISSHIRLIL